MLNEITARLVAEFDPEAIDLFGSYARGEPSDDSDVNLAVIVACQNAPAHRDFVRAHGRLDNLGLAKDVLTERQSRFERYRHVPASLDYKITEKGKLLYERTRDKRGEERTRQRVALNSLKRSTHD